MASGGLTPAIAALTIGGALAVAGVQNRNLLDVLLGRAGNPLSPSPIGSSSGGGASSIGGPLEVVKNECDRIDGLRLPYKWGGGHAGYPHDGPFDCSGAVSYVLHSAGLLKGPPLVSGLLAAWGHPGKGDRLTVWANVGHVFLELDGRMWGTSRQNPGGGPGWHTRGTAGFTPRHHPALEPTARLSQQKPLTGK